MKQEIDISRWNRKAHFAFFSQFDEPFYGVVVRIDCTEIYKQAKAAGRSFFLSYLYRALKAANSVENFRYRIIDGKVFLLDQIDASPTVDRPDHTFGFGYVPYSTDEEAFHANASTEMEEVRQQTDLRPSKSGDSTIHFSALPWLDFTSVSHARNFKYPDSCPKISFGKMVEENGRRTMAISIHVHHALVDGYHVGQFVEAYQKLMNGEVLA